MVSNSRPCHPRSIERSRDGFGVVKGHTAHAAHLRLRSAFHPLPTLGHRPENCRADRYEHEDYNRGLHPYGESAE